MSDYNLKGKIGDYGPWEEKESKWLLLSVGSLETKIELINKYL